MPENNNDITIGILCILPTTYKLELFRSVPFRVPHHRHHYEQTSWRRASCNCHLVASGWNVLAFRKKYDYCYFYSMTIADVFVCSPPINKGNRDFCFFFSQNSESIANPIVLFVPYACCAGFSWLLFPFI